MGKGYEEQESVPGPAHTMFASGLEKAHFHPKRPVLGGRHVSFGATHGRHGHRRWPQELTPPIRPSSRHVLHMTRGESFAPENAGLVTHALGRASAGLSAARRSLSASVLGSCSAASVFQACVVVASRAHMPCVTCHSHASTRQAMACFVVYLYKTSSKYRAL